MGTTTDLKRAGAGKHYSQVTDRRYYLGHRACSEHIEHNHYEVQKDRPVEVLVLVSATDAVRMYHTSAWTYDDLGWEPLTAPISRRSTSLVTYCPLRSWIPATWRMGLTWLSLFTVPLVSYPCNLRPEGCREVCIRPEFYSRENAEHVQKGKANDAGVTYKNDKTDEGEIKIEGSAARIIDSAEAPDWQVSAASTHQY